MSQLSVPEQSETSADFHTPFLERASDPDGEDSQHALGAFLALRIVDQFAKEDLNAVGLGYQIASAVNYLADLAPRTAEVDRLEAIVMASKAALCKPELEPVIKALSVYARELEREYRLEESLDVLDTATRVAEAQVIDEFVALNLQRARALRLAGRLSQAREAYESAGRLAAHKGDTHSELLSRIGRGLVLQFLGNLPEAHQMLESVRIDAMTLGDRDAEARATHDLSVTAAKRDDHADSVSYAFRAYQLYDDERFKKRALADLGSSLQALGHYAAASDAFEIVLAGDIPVNMRVAATIELIELATLTGNQMMFEKRRREVEGLDVELPPSTRVDYEIKVGVGLSEFGNADRGRVHLETAIALAEEHNLNGFLFKAEGELELILNKKIPVGVEPISSTPQQYSPDVVSVAHELRAIRVTV